MPDMGDISAILGLLSSGNADGQTENCSEEGSGGGIFGSIDADMLIKLMEVFSQLNEKDKNTELILALKPHLRPENRDKAEKAAELVKLMSVLTIFGDGNLFKF